MTAALLLASLLSAGAMYPGPADLLETMSVVGWAAVPLGSEPRTLLDGLPVSDAGMDRLPPWGVLGTVELRSPVAGGLWSGGRWSLEVTDHEIPDSSYYSRVGLFQNTFDRHRYTGSLRRPLPWGMGMDVTAGREDSLRMERIRLAWRGITADGLAWREDDDAYSAWIGGSPLPGVFARASLSSPSEGNRWPGGLVQAGVDWGRARLEAGAAAAATGDSSRLEGHLLGQLPVGAVTFAARGDMDGPADDPEAGFGGGLMAALGPVELSAGVVSPPGEGLTGVLSAAAGPASLGLQADERAVTAGAGVGLDWGLTRIDLRGGVDSRDSLEAEARLLPGVRIVNARLRAGGRFRARGSTNGDWDLHGDAIASYTLSTFSIVVALEDLEDLREGGTSFTYGVLWSFTDEARRPEREGNGEGGG